MEAKYGNVLRGFSLVEVLVSLLVFAVLVVLAAPQMMTPLRQQRARGAADSLRASLEQGRSEAIKRGQYLFLSVSSGTNWCYALSWGEACGCETACSSSDRLLEQRQVADYPGVSIPSVSFAGTLCGATECARFEPVRGTAGGSNGTVVFQGETGARYHVVVSNLGRVRSCEESGDQAAGLAHC